MFTLNALKVLHRFYQEGNAPNTTWSVNDCVDITGATATLNWWRTGTNIYSFATTANPSSDSPMAFRMYYITNGTRMYYGNNSTTSNPTGVIIGDGTGTLAPDRYTLFGNQITDFSATTALTSSVSNDGIVITATYNITNTGASDFTIKEIALTGGFTPCMIDHQLLDAPVTVSPGATKSIVYRLKIS